MTNNSSKKNIKLGEKTNNSSKKKEGLITTWREEKIKSSLEYKKD